MAFFKGTATDYQDFLNQLKNLVKDDHVSAAGIYDGGTGYAVGDTITLSGGTKYHEPELEVRGISSGDYISNAVVAAGGTGYVVGDELYPVGGTFSVGAVLEVTSVSGGVVTGVQINNPGICSSQPGNPVSTTTDGSGVNCTLTLTFTAGTGIITACHIADAGVYTAQASNPVAQNTTSGSGTGAKFDLTYTDTAWETKVDYRAYEATAAAISTAGTGYTTNDIVTVVGGSFTVAATVKILTVSGGVPQTIEVHTELGDYISTPDNPASTSGGTGSGLTLTMSWAYTVAEHQYLMIHNTTTDQYIGWKTEKETSPSDAFLVQCVGFSGFTSTSTPWGEQPGSSADGVHEDTYVPLSGGAAPATIYYWLNVNDKRVTGAFKIASVYPNMYVGAPNTLLTAAEWAYPQVILGCLARRVPYTYGGVDFAGMNNPGVQLAGSASYQGPGWLRMPDGQFKQILNWYISINNPQIWDYDINVGPTSGVNYPLPAVPNAWYDASTNWRALFSISHTTVPTYALKRINSEWIMIPVTLAEKSPALLFGNLDGIFCFNPDGAINAEDRIYIGSAIYRCFQNCNKSNRNYFYAIREN